MTAPLKKGRSYRGQSSLAKSRVQGRLPGYSLYGYLLECVVAKCRFPDDPGNKTGLVEYDVDPIVPGFGRLFNANFDQEGLYDGDEIILRESTAQPDGSAWNSETSPRTQGDGDWVLVGFINGSIDRPTILKRIPNPASTIISQTKSDKTNYRTRTISHRGTTLQLDGQGNVDLTLDKNDDPVYPSNAKKTFTITIGTIQLILDNSTSPSTATFKLKGGNPLATFTFGQSGTDPEIDFGVGADQHFVLGEALMSFLANVNDQVNQMATELSSHTHLGNMGAPTSPPVDSAAFIAFAAQFLAYMAQANLPVPANTMLSTWIQSKQTRP